MSEGALGKSYKDGEIIVRQGDDGDCMYVIQSGKVQVVREQDGKELELAVMGEGDFFGEMAIFERQKRAATVRAHGDAKVLTVDKRTLLQRIQADPSLAFRMIETLAHRVRELGGQLIRESPQSHKPTLR